MWKRRAGLGVAAVLRVTATSFVKCCRRSSSGKSCCLPHVTLAYVNRTHYDTLIRHSVPKLECPLRKYNKITLEVRITEPELWEREHAVYFRARWLSFLRYIIRGELSYLAPLGSEKISAPYFKQCFFRGGGLPPRLSQTPRLPVPRQK